MGILAIEPATVEPGARANATGSGYRKAAATRLRVQVPGGTDLLTQVFATTREGAFEVGTPPAPAAEGTYPVVVEQRVGKGYQAQPGGDSLVVKHVIVPVPEPEPDPPPAPQPGGSWVMPPMATALETRDLAAVLAGYPAGATVDLAPAVWRLRGLVRPTQRGLRVNFNGGVLDGGGQLGELLMTGAADQAFDGLYVRNVRDTGVVQSAAINLQDQGGASLTHVDGVGGPYALVRALNAPAHLIAYVRSHAAPGEGVWGWNSPDGYMHDVRVTGTNPRRADGTWRYDPTWEAGGVKVGNSKRYRMERCEASHNGGLGLWLDVYDSDSGLTACRTDHNDFSGIMVEIQDGGWVRDCVSWEDGWNDPRRFGWPWGAGILIASDGDVEVVRCVVAWCPDSVGVVSQRRMNTDGLGGNPAGTLDPPNNGRDIRVVGNTLTKAPRWVQDWAGPLLTSTGAVNTAAGNVNGPNVIVAQDDPRLAAAGVPLRPEAH